MASINHPGLRAIKKCNENHCFLKWILVDCQRGLFRHTYLENVPYLPQTRSLRRERKEIWLHFCSHSSRPGHFLPLYSSVGGGIGINTSVYQHQAN